MQRAPRGARRSGAAPRRAVRAAAEARAPVDAEFASGQQDRRLDHHGLRADPAQPDPRPADWASGSCRSSPTRRAPSAWTRCSRRSASTPPTGSATTRSTPNLVLSYRESQDGQVLEEGINEAGSMASLIAAGTSYATHGEPMIPFYIFYSMFGFQRTGDQAWAFGDQRGRGFMIGATAGRTTLAGEGLQHDDGHTQVLASTKPVVRAYDPAFAYELAAVIRDGIERMYGDGEDVFYYVTVYNENYSRRPSPRASTRGSSGASTGSPTRPRSRARRAASAWSARLDPAAGHRRPGPAGERTRDRGGGLLGDVVPAAPPRGAAGRAVEPPQPGQEPARAVRRAGPGARRRPDRRGDGLDPDAAGPRRPWVPDPYLVLGTDGFGRSDTRENLRAHFEIEPRASPRRRCPGSRGAAASTRGRRPSRSGRWASTRRAPTRSSADGRRRTTRSAPVAPEPSPEGRSTGPARGSAVEVFLATLRLGLTSFGGPIAHIDYQRRAFVVDRGWLTRPRSRSSSSCARRCPGRRAASSRSPSGGCAPGWSGRSPPGSGSRSRAPDHDRARAGRVPGADPGHGTARGRDPRPRGRGGRDRGERIAHDAASAGARPAAPRRSPPPRR